MGASSEQASIVVAEIADREAEDIRNIGLGYLHRYLERLKVGKVKPHLTPKILKTSVASTVISARFFYVTTPIWWARQA